MEYYIILAISFAIMYHFRYTKEILEVVKQVAIIHDATPNATIKLYSFITFFITIIAFPLYAIVTITQPREKIIKEHSTTVLITYYDLVNKK
jgi:hypothetical protein